MFVNFKCSQNFVKCFYRILILFILGTGIRPMCKECDAVQNTDYDSTESEAGLTSIIGERITKVSNVNPLSAPQIGANVVRKTAVSIPGINVGIKTVFLRLYDSYRNDVNCYKDVSIKSPNVLSIFTQKSGYDPNKISVFFTHGFIDASDRDLTTNLVSALLSRGSYNVFTVDWSKLNLPPYTVAVQNLKTVGETIAEVLNQAITKGVIKVADIHLIGHSLGAHLSGYIGRNLVTRPPVIIGLDPAGPAFQTNFAAKKLTHLDADVVHYIQTNRFLLGCDFELGRANFKFNGPAIAQPGCITPICSHLRAVTYFAEAIRNPGLFVAIQCDTYDQFKEGTCSGKKSVIGFPVDLSANGIYYISTDSKEPFGRGQEGTKA